MTNSAGSGDFARGSASAMLDACLPSARPSRARTWISAAIGLVIFIAGLICGAVAIGVAHDSKRPMNWGDLLDRVAERMRYDLDLTKAQQASIKTIVRARQPNLDQIRARTIKETRGELEQVIEEMSAVLTPDQASRFRSEAQPRLDKYFPPDGEKRDRKRATD